MDSDRTSGSDESAVDLEIAPQLSSRAWARLAHRPRAVARRFVHELAQQSLFDQSATLAFWFLFSFFPLLLALFGIFGRVIESRVGLEDSLMAWFAEMAPDDTVAALVHRVLEDLQQGADGKLVIGVLVALWAGSNALNQVQRAVDRGAPEWLAEAGMLSHWRRRIAALPLTVLVATPLVAAIALHFYGGLIGRGIAAQLDLAQAFASIWPWLRWPTLVLALLTSFDLAFNTSPSQLGRRNHWLSPGAVLAILLWFLVSEFLRIYVATTLRHSPVFGSLGGVVMLLFWFYVSSAAILAGIRLNQVLAEPTGETPS